MGTEFRQKRVVVMGLGRFGGGIGVTRWLADQGAAVRVTDQATAAELESSVAQLADLPVDWRLGGHHVDHLDGAELLVVSPAVDKQRSDLVRTAVDRRIPITSELNLFVERCPGQIIGVTGTAGKSTTTAMIFDVLHANLEHLVGRPQHIWLGGNLGASLLGDLPRITPCDYVVLELSSFQLEDLAPLRRSPRLAVLTNLSPQHLDRHGTFARYLDAKRVIFAFQGPDDWAVISAQAAAVLGDRQPGPARTTVFERAEALRGRLQVVGDHHLANAAAALEVGRLLGLSDPPMIEELCRFKGLPHRLELVREYQQVRYYNDSKSTMPASTITALECFEDPVVLLCGGQEKAVSFDELAAVIRSRVRLVICFGETRAKIATWVRRSPAGLSRPAIKTVHEFNGGVNLARRLARPGEVVLFSPGCPSFDGFANYADRGDHFRAIVRGWV